MTTIASNLNRMAADSFVNLEGCGAYHTYKLERVNDSIVGCAGPSDWCRQFMAWRRGERKQPRFSAACRFEALVLNKIGLFLFENDCMPNRIVTGWHAIGSGRAYALAVLHHRGTPQEAVEVACKLDSGSKLPLIVERL